MKLRKSYVLKLCDEIVRSNGYYLLGQNGVRVINGRQEDPLVDVKVFIAMVENDYGSWFADLDIEKGTMENLRVSLD